MAIQMRFERNAARVSVAANTAARERHWYTVLFWGSRERIETMAAANPPYNKNRERYVKTKSETSFSGVPSADKDEARRLILIGAIKNIYANAAQLIRSVYNKASDGLNPVITGSHKTSAIIFTGISLRIVTRISRSSTHNNASSTAHNKIIFVIVTAEIITDAAERRRHRPSKDFSKSFLNSNRSRYIVRFNL